MNQLGYYLYIQINRYHNWFWYLILLFNVYKQFSTHPCKNNKKTIYKPKKHNKRLVRKQLNNRKDVLKYLKFSFRRGNNFILFIIILNNATKGKKATQGNSSNIAFKLQTMYNKLSKIIHFLFPFTAYFPCKCIRFKLIFAILYYIVLKQ